MPPRPESSSNKRCLDADGDNRGIAKDRRFAAVRAGDDPSPQRGVNGTGQVRVNDLSGADDVVQVNTGGSLAPDIEIRLSATRLSQMGADDFVL
jgi:hypothetical protein